MQCQPIVYMLKAGDLTLFNKKNLLLEIGDVPIDMSNTIVMDSHMILPCNLTSALNIIFQSSIKLIVILHTLHFLKSHLPYFHHPYTLFFKIILFHYHYLYILSFKTTSTSLSSSIHFIFQSNINLILLS